MLRPHRGYVAVFVAGFRGLAGARSSPLEIGKPLKQFPNRLRSRMHVTHSRLYVIVTSQILQCEGIGVLPGLGQNVCRNACSNVGGCGIVDGLLHAVADVVVVVLGLNDGDRDVGLVIKDVVSALGLAAGDEFSADDDASLGKSDFLADLRHPVPARALDGRADELGADVAFA